MRTQANALLQSLFDYAGSTGTAVVRLDTDDTMECMLGETPVFFSYADETEELIACAYLGPLPEGTRRGDLVAEIMRGNYAGSGTGGGILGLDDQSGMVVMSHRFGAEGCRAEFLEWAARFYGGIQYWHKVLADDGKPAAAQGLRP